MLAILSLLFVLAAIEGALRIMGFNPVRDYYQNDNFQRLQNGRELILRPSSIEERGYEATPKSEGYAWNTNIKINSYGFRDHEYSLAKQSSTIRIVAIGDSITFGNFLPLSQTFSKQLERLFAPNEATVEVLNLGLGGYNTLQEASTLEHLGLQFEPDLVIVGYCINDIFPSSPNFEYIKRIEKYNSPLFYLRIAQLLQVKLDIIRQKSAAKSLTDRDLFITENERYFADISEDTQLHFLMKSLQEEILNTPGKLHSSVPLYADEPYIQKLRYSLDHLKSLQNSSGSPPITFMVIPYLGEDQNTKHVYQTVYEIIRHEVRRQGFAYLNAHHLFEQAGFGNLHRSSSDRIHPNEAGHVLLAEYLYSHLSESVPALSGQSQ